MKNTTIGIIIGVCVTITVLSVYYLFQMNNRVVQLEVFATQLAQAINNNKK
jgi:ABC-type lipoprotein release transport system permease subunit